MILSNKQHWRFRGRDLTAARFKGRDVWPKSVTPELVRLTPAMTSNTTPAPFVASASSSVGSNAYAAWSQNQNNFWYTQNHIFDPTDGRGDQYNQVKLDTERTIKRLVLKARGQGLQYIGGSPRDFTLMGSLDGAVFFNIGTYTDVGKPTSLYQTVFDQTIQGIRARFVRIRVTRTWINTGYNDAAIGEIELYGF